MSLERKRGFDDAPFIHQATHHIQRSALSLELLGDAQSRVPHIQHSVLDRINSARFDFIQISFDGFIGNVQLMKAHRKNGSTVHRVAVFPKPDHNGFAQTVFKGGALKLSYRIESDGMIGTRCRFEGTTGDLEPSLLKELSVPVLRHLDRVPNKTEIYLYDNKKSSDESEPLPEFHLGVYTDRDVYSVDEWGQSANSFQFQSNALLSRALNAAEGLITHT